MSAINGIDSTNSLLQSQLQSAKAREDIKYRVAAKTLDAARDQGDMVLQLLGEAAQVAKSAPGDTRGVTVGAIVSGLGQTVDIMA